MPETITCPNCKKEVRQGAKFCSYCNMKMPDTNTIVAATHRNIPPPTPIRPVAVPPPVPSGQRMVLPSLTPAAPHAPTTQLSNLPPVSPIPTNSHTLPSTAPTTNMVGQNSPNMSAPSPSLPTPSSPTTPSSTTKQLTRPEIRQLLKKLQNPPAGIEQFFPAQLPDKAAKLSTWQREIERAEQTLSLLDNPLLHESTLPKDIEQTALSTLSNAMKALDFTREYTVKLLGATGTGKSTLLNAILGRDILPTGQGTAVTGVPIRIVLCDPQEEPNEQLFIHFLLRQEFDRLFDATKVAADKEAAEQKAKGITLTPQQEELINPFTRELKHLTYLRDQIYAKTGKSYKESYLQTTQPSVLSFPENQWETSGRDFVMEPPTKDDPYLARLVDYAEYRIHVRPDSVLPVGSIWLDLPGGSAGQVRHEMILDTQLQELDAVILTAGGERYDDDRAVRIFKQVRDLLWRRHPDVAPQMVFVAATNWDKNGPEANRQGSKSAMRTLLAEFPASYRASHQSRIFPIDEDRESLIYYPVIAFGARMATIGLHTTKIEARQQQELPIYKGVITTVYDKLRQIDTHLPQDFVAQDFKDFPHDAMYKLSGLPELINDLQVFLTTQRYTVQLEQARSQLNSTLSSLEEICWNYVNAHSSANGDLEALRRESRERPGRIEADRIKRLQELFGKMGIAWQQALDTYDIARRQSLNRSSFYMALSDACQQAIEYMKQRIDSKDFDKFIQVPNYTRSGRAKPILTITTREGSIEIRGNDLLTELRSGLAGVLNQLVQKKPADELASMFLSSIRAQGSNTGGALDIDHITFRETSSEIDAIRKSYKKLLSDLSTTASQVCRFVTIGDLFDEKHELAKSHPLMRQFYALADKEIPDGTEQGKTPEEAIEEIFEEGRNLMKQMVDVLSSDLVNHVHKRVTFIYRNELEETNMSITYNINTPGAPPSRNEPGLFKKISSDWFSATIRLLSQSPTLQAKIDGTSTRGPEIDSDGWAHLIESIQKLRGFF